MIDFHTHILPGMDDGSHSVEESLSMLQMLWEEGATAVIATPHFYANDESVDAFLARRNAAYENLRARLPEDAPEIRLGAEVRYYPGIAKMSDLKRLRIEGSRLLLLEMPMTTWTEYTVRELGELAGKAGLTVVLAHIDRYLAMQKASVWERLLKNGVLMQVNASFFTEFRTKRKAISMLNRGEIHFIGSDCHNMTTRPPRIERAVSTIQKKFGDDFIAQMNEYGTSMLRK